MCYDEGVLQELMDGEYQGDALEIRRHLNSCPACRERYDQLKGQEILVKNALHLGYEEKESELERTLMTIENKRKRKVIKMKKMHWSIKTAAAAVLCGALVFTAPGAALADQFLNLFRTQDVQAVAITNDDIYQLEGIFQKGEGKVEIDKIGTFESASEGEVKHIDTLDNTTALTAHMPGIKVIPLTEGTKYESAMLSPKTEMRFTLHVKPLNELLAAMGKEASFPETLDGNTFSIGADKALGYTIEMADEKGSLHAAVSGMPVIGMPEGTDHNEILATLNETGLLPDGLADKLAGLDNLSTVLPIPYMEETQTKTETEINGTAAVIIKDKEGQRFTIFMKDGAYLYIYSGWDITADDAIKLIETQE